MLMQINVLPMINADSLIALLSTFIILSCLCLGVLLKLSRHGTLDCLLQIMLLMSHHLLPSYRNIMVNLKICHFSSICLSITTMPFDLSEISIFTMPLLVLTCFINISVKIDECCRLYYYKNLF